LSLHPPAPPPPHAYVSILNVGAAPSTLSLASVASSQKREKRGKKKKKPSRGLEPPSPPPKDDEHLHMLDTDINEMEGIVNFRKVGLPSDGESSANGHLPSDPGPSSYLSLDFTNPFVPTSTTDKRKAIIPMDYRKVSPKTVIPPGFNQIPNSSTSNLNGDGPGSSTWTPPESWAVEKEEGGDPDAVESSSDDSVVGGKGKGCAMNGDGGPKQYRKRKQVKKQQRLSVISERPYRIRIYRTNNTYHVFSIPFNVTVAALTPTLNKKLLLGNDRVQHRLYLKERGRGMFPFVCFSPCSQHM
jgi:adenylate cyclase